MAIGYALSSEEHSPQRLIDLAAHAEAAGFEFAFISDHYHPWIDRQGQSPFVWGVLGGISQATTTLRVGTGVTCPLIRIHPAVIAQAAATAAILLKGRFMLGLGTGENLNEHIVGMRWPPAETRRDMLEEAVEIIRELWRGEPYNHKGPYFNVEDARIYSLPETPPPILIAASGPESAELAGRISDGLITTSPDRELVKAFNTKGKKQRPKYGQVTVCVADDDAEARRIAREWWPTAALVGPEGEEFRIPSHFERAVRRIREDDVAEKIVCSVNPKRHVQAIGKFLDAGFDHVYVHQVGPDQEALFDLYQKHVLPEITEREPVRIR